MSRRLLSTRLALGPFSSVICTSNMSRWDKCVGTWSAPVVRGIPLGEASVVNEVGLASIYFEVGLRGSHLGRGV
jgi:hypothetical protein